LTERAASGSPFDPNSLSHRTVASWFGQDPWLLGVAAVLIPAGLVIRRLRPITAAFTILAAMVLRPGYLPVPLVVAMLPFASLLIAGVADAAWGWSANQVEAADTSRRAYRSRALGPVLVLACLALAVAVVAPGWWQRDHDLMTVDQDRPFRQAEAWIAANVPHQARLLVDDAVWVDLVERGYPPSGSTSSTPTVTSEAATRAAAASSTIWSPPPPCGASPTACPRPVKPNAAPGSWPASVAAPIASRSARSRVRPCRWVTYRSRSGTVSSDIP
jgi:hypothetical protein